MSIQVKICGLTNLDDALDAVELGADFLGFNFYPDSPRFIEPKKALRILEEIPSAIQKVGVFVNEDPQDVTDLAIELGLDMVQFHGDESPEYCQAFGCPWIKAFQLKNEKDVSQIPFYGPEYILVDTYVEKVFGGSGVVGNWDLARAAKKYGKLFLSGGLNTDNIDLALEAVDPYAVDVASGIEEAPGKKDRFKMERFIKIVKAYALKKAASSRLKLV